MTVASSSWQLTDAKVMAIEFRPKSAELRYEYLVGGIPYVGDTFAFLSSGSIPDKDLIEKTYHVGDQIKVLVNPVEPKESVVLRRTLRVEYDVSSLSNNVRIRQPIPLLFIERRSNHVHKYRPASPRAPRNAGTNLSRVP